MKMKLKEYISWYCETCKKMMKGRLEEREHFHQNHTIRVRGLGIIKGDPIVVGRVLDHGEGNFATIEFKEENSLVSPTRGKGEVAK